MEKIKERLLITIIVLSIITIGILTCLRLQNREVCVQNYQNISTQNENTFALN
jgi:hypothetical protein